MAKAPEPRKGMPGPQLSEDRFRERFLSAYTDPVFETLAVELSNGSEHR